jgi:hypothetical protein
MFSKSIWITPVLAILLVAAPANALLEDWEKAVVPALPNFFATNVADGLYDIGTYGGNQTYEFVVKSNPYETERGMALIGRRERAGLSTPPLGVGLKFEQWDSIPQYGVTLYGRADRIFGVANNPGVDTHLVFVSSQAAGTCRLYVNGVYRASISVAFPASLSGIVGIGCAYQVEPYMLFENFDGVIYGVAIYNRILSDSEILAHSDAYFLPPREVMLADMAVFVTNQVGLGNIAPELEESLLVKIGAALAALNRDNPNEAKVAMNDLRALINQVEAQTNKKITPEAAAEITRRANAIIAALDG